jgi:hypothetical protein
MVFWSRFSRECSVGETLRVKSEACTEVVEVARGRRAAEELLDDGEEVVEGGDGGEGRRIGRPEGPSGGGQEEGGVDGVEGDGLVEEVLGEAAVGGSGAAAGTGGFAVQSEEAAGVGLAFVGSGRDGVCHRRVVAKSSR